MIESRAAVFIVVSILIHALVLFIALPTAEKAESPQKVQIPVSLRIKSEVLQPVAEPVAEEPPEAAAHIEEPTELPPAELEPESEPILAPRPEPVDAVVDNPAEVAPVPQPNPDFSGEPGVFGDASVGEQTEVAPAATGTNPFAGLIQRISREKSASYPLSARKRGYQGTVIVQIKLDADGKLTNSVILEHCRYPVLDEAALKLIAKVMQEPYPHNTGKEVVIKLPITFRLR